MIAENSRPSEVTGQKRGLDWLLRPDLGMQHLLLALLIFTLLTLGLQFASGAYQSEFGGYPDEPAHYVTGLMVHDYIVSLNWFSPMQFARDYYAHYPKVAFGHWPPLLYIVQAAWMLIFSTSRASVLLELAFLTIVLALSVYRVTALRFGWIAGLLSGILTIALPIVQVFTAEVMAETLLMLVSFWGAIYFARYLDSERWQDSAWFGIFSSLAILTKGNGWEMAIIPPVAILLTRRYRVVLKPSLWVSAVIVAVLCLPWQVMTLEMAHRGWTGGDQPTLQYALKAMGQFLLILAGIGGPVLTVLAVAGILTTILEGYIRKNVDAQWACFAGLIFSAWLFHVLVPAGIESRKMIAGVPAIVCFIFAGGYWLANRIPVPDQVQALRPVLIAILAGLAFALQTFAIPHEQHYGFMEVAQYIAAQPQKVVLVSSERDGEGMLISELTMDEKRPTHTVLRGTKLLSRSDWTGEAYECFVTSTRDLIRVLHENHVELLVVDNMPARNHFLHHRLIEQTVISEPDILQLRKSFSGGSIRVYAVN